MKYSIEPIYFSAIFLNIYMKSCGLQAAYSKKYLAHKVQKEFINATN